MPATSASTIINSILEAITQSGGVAVYALNTEETHPAKFIVKYSEQNFTIWVYIWTLTHGGRPSLPDEYRIQMTGVNSPLPMNPNGYTVLMGYHHDLNMFAGFDINKHRKFTVGSPSVQIDITTIHEALQNGLAFSTKENNEIVIGIRADQFLHYVIDAEKLHKEGKNNKLTPLLNKAVSLGKISNIETKGLSKERKLIIANISRYSRDASFRQQVLTAYGYRCAVTRAQLRLVNAAHILPVPVQESIDHVTNGICLSPTVHLAYDNCLIYLDEHLFMQVNEEKASELVSVKLDAGLVEFRKNLNAKIHLPPDKKQWPDPEFIKKANKYRLIPGYH